MDQAQRHQELLEHLEGWFVRIEELIKAQDARPLPQAYLPHGAHGASIDSPHLTEDQFKVTVNDAMPSEDGTADVPPAGTPQGFKNRMRRTQSHISYEKAKERSTHIETFKRARTEAESENKRVSALSQWWQRHVKSRCAYITQAIPFNVFFAFVILSNSMFLGIQLEVKAANPGQNISFLVPNLLYAILFTVEMAIRICAVGPVHYLCEKGAAWNWLDVLVVVPAWIEMVLEFQTQEGVESGGAASNFRIIRIFKITRLLQVVRSLRIVKFISALRALVMSVVDTTRQLLWALILLGLVQYSFGILFTDAVLDYATNHEATSEQMRYFGTVYQSFMTLFRSILGGLDWHIAADSLDAVGWIWVQVFHLYIAFCGFAVLNVMTGVFVNSAIKTRERDHETLIQNKNHFMGLVSKIWSKMDSDGSGQITISEFERMFEDESMKAFFSAIELNAVDAWTLFDSLDVDGDHTIDMDEFVERCMQLHGPARSVDLYALKKGIKHLEGHQRRMADHIAVYFASMDNALASKLPFSC